MKLVVIGWHQGDPLEASRDLYLEALCILLRNLAGKP